MESIGAKIKAKREELGYSIEQVARDTHIAKRFLYAIEEEDFSVFPGEPYLFGFLRNYSQYLGLDPQEMVNLYKNLRLQEQPAPINELLVKRSPKPYIIGAVIVVFIGLLIGAGILLIPRLGRGGGAPGADEVAPLSESQAEEAPDAAEGDLILKDEILEQRFSLGDGISIPVGDMYHRLVLTGIDDNLTISTPVGPLTIEVNQEERVDLNGDEHPDIRLILRSLSGEGENASAVIRLDRVVQSPATGGLVEAADSAGSSVSEEQVIGSSAEASRIEKPIRVLSSEEKESFSVEIEFSGNCLFRSIVDDRPRQEKYFSDDDIFRTSVREKIRFWASNAGAMRTRIGGEEVRIGSQGEVRSGLFIWTYDEEKDQYNLMLIPAY